MIKNVSVNALSTPSGNIELAERMMGHVVQSQPRWSPGSLVNSILSESEVPLVVLISKYKIVALVGSGLGKTWISDDFIDAGIATGTEIFEQVEGTSKSREVDCDKITIPSLDLTLSSPGLPLDHPIYDVFKPKRPTFTVLSLVNALESALFDKGDDYIIAVSQNDASVVVGTFSDGIAVDDYLSAVIASGMINGISADKVAIFDTTFEVSDPGTPSFGWE